LGDYRVTPRAICKYRDTDLRPSRLVWLKPDAALMRVDKARYDGFPLQVNDLRGRICQHENILVAANCHNAIALIGNRLRLRLGIIHGEDDAVAKKSLLRMKAMSVEKRPHTPLG
jgi:hypothetical protein